MRVQAKEVDRGEGAYRIAAVSGLLTAVAAATATAGHVFSMRWAPAASNPLKKLVLQRLRAKWITISEFTAAQEIGLDVIVARAYTAAHTGGTAIDLATNTNTNKKRAAFPTSSIADIRIGTTGALTAGTQTLDANPLGRDGFSELAALATVPPGSFALELTTVDLDRHPIVLDANEGLVVRNAIAMGAGGTARLIVEMDWLELARY